MRILSVTDVAAPVGGAETYARRLAELLTVNGHDVLMLHGGDDTGGPAGFRTVAAKSTNVDGLLSDFAAEIVHVHGRSVPPVVRSHARRGTPLIRDFHDFSFGCASGTKYFRDGAVCSRAHGPGCLVDAAARGCVHRRDPRPFVAAYRRVGRELSTLRSSTDTLIVHSRFVQAVAAANGLPPDRVEVIAPFVERAPGPLSVAARRTVVFAGRLVPDTGLDVLIDALHLCRASWDELLVAGDGWDRTRCGDLVRRLGLESRVRFLGHIAENEVRAALAQAYVVVVPSRWPEPFGLVGIEAMAQGRPVVASAVGGIPEWLDDGETGILVPPGDPAALAAALDELLGQPARAETMGREGWARAGRFSPETHLSRLLGLYEKAVAARPARAEAAAG